MIDHGPLLLKHRDLREDGRRLKIGVAVSGDVGPAWIRDLIEFLRSIRYFEVCVFSIGAQRHKDAIPVLTERLYAFSRRRFDPFGPVGLPVQKNATTEETGAAELDMLVWLAPESLPSGSCAGLAKFGVFTVQLGDVETQAPFWRESRESDVRRSVFSTVIYWHAKAFERARAVRTAETSTMDGWFFTRNVQEPLIAACRMIASIGLDIFTAGVEWKARSLDTPEVEHPPPHQDVYPSNLASARFIARQTARSLRLRLQGRGRKFTWFTALRRKPSLFYANLGKFSTEELEETPLAPGSEMADPFVFTHDGKTWLFYEEVPPGELKGRLSCVEIGEAPGVFSKPEVILDKSYHLSYPCIFAHAGEIFLLPETSADGTVQLYRTRRFPHHFELEAILMEGLSLVDTTPFLLDGCWYFFTTTTQPFMETFLFWSETLDGKWRLHPRSPISSSVTNSRSAGHLFYHNRRLLRPTQDCSIRYGYGMTINEIKRLTPTEFEEERVDFIGPDWRPGLLGTHTLNSNSMVEVVDGIRYRQ